MWLIRFAGMAHRLDHLSPFGERKRYAPMHKPIPLAVTSPQHVGGIPTQHRMEPEPPVGDLLHESDQRRERLQAMHRASLQDGVQEIRVSPLEQPDFQDEPAVGWR